MTDKGKAYVQTRDGDVIEVKPSEVKAKLESGDYLPATGADKAEADKRASNSTVGAKAKTFAESAAAGAIDVAQAPIALPLRANAALWGDEDPLQGIHGRQTVENLASIFGSAKNTITGKNETGESYGRQYGENARDRAAENPGTATAGNVAGSLLAGGALSGGAGAIGGSAAKALGEGALARAAGAVTTGALEGAAYGQAQAGEEAYLHNIPLSGEKLIAAMGWGAVLGGGVSLAAHGAGALLRRGSRGATPIDSPRLGEGADLGNELPRREPLTPATTEDAARFLREQPEAKALENFLGGDHRKASSYWNDGGYDGTAKRAGKETAEKQKRFFDEVNTVLSRANEAGVTAPGTVYSGRKWTQPKIDAFLGDPKNGIWSTSTSQKQALDFATDNVYGELKPVLLEIEQHSGVPVSGLQPSGMLKNEREVLLGSDRKWDVLGHTTEETADGPIVKIKIRESAPAERSAPSESGEFPTAASFGADVPLDASGLPPVAPAPGKVPSALRDFADERTAKALGARGSTLKKLGRTAEQAEATMHDMAQTVRGVTLDDGTPVFRALDSQPELAARVAQAKEEAGAKLGAFREEADKVIEAHPEIAPNPDAIADRIEKDVVIPLENHPLSASRAQAAPVRQLANDVRALRGVGVGGEEFAPKISDLTKLRQGLDDQIYQAKRGVNLTQQGAPPNLKDLERARGILEESIEAASDKAATLFDKKQALSYRELKTQWRHLNLASDIAGAAELQDLGNRVVSPSDYGAGAIGGILGGGPVGALASGIAHKTIREHSSAVLAVLADKLANNLDGKIESGLGAFFRESTARAASSVSPVAGAVSAVPIRRIATPAAVDAFMGRSKDLATAYDKRVRELVDANRDMGGGVRGAMQAAMGGGYETMPRLTQAATVTATRGAQYLQAQLPGGTAAPTVFQPSRKSLPSDLQIREFAQKWSAVANPLSVIDDLRRGTVTHAQIDALKAVYPQMYAEVQQKALTKIRELDEQGKRMPFNDRLSLDLFLDLDGAGEPTLAGKFIDRVAGAQAAKAHQDAQQKPHGSSGALAKIGASRQSGAQTALGG